MKTILQLLWSFLVDVATSSEGAMPLGSETKDFLQDLANERTEERIANWRPDNQPVSSNQESQGQLKITVK